MSRWDDIKIDLTEVGWMEVNWIYRTQDRGQWWHPVNTGSKLLLA
jgi:hypothetical protein